MEPLILGEEETPAIAEDKEVVAAPQPAMMRAQLEAEPEFAPEPQPQARRRFGFLGRKGKKPEPRTEPAPARAAAGPAADVFVQTKNPRPPQGNLAEDLFPEQKDEDQFEIPAFLRRQTN